MYESATQAITAALSISLGLPVRAGTESNADEVRRAREHLLDAADTVSEDCVNAQRFVYAAYDGMADDVLLAGPFRVAGDPDGPGPLLDAADVERLRASLGAAATGLRHVLEEPRLRLELSRQMEILSSAIVAISGELQLEKVLRRITDLARSFAAAKYAALGVPDAHGRIATFITAGVSEEEEVRIGQRPVGRGLLGLLLQTRQPIRLDNLTQHPAAAGFPPHHPAMTTFLGVPIISRSGAVIGSLYLTEKRFGTGFTLEDELLIELLARHAAVAIENASLYERLEAEERRLEQILDQLPEAVMLVEPGNERIVVMNRNARRLLGQNDALPMPLDKLEDSCQFVTPDGEPIPFEHTPVIRAMRSGSAISKSELTISSGTGQSRTLLINSEPIDLDSSGGACVCVFQDITEIRDADRLKDDFLSLVSHELRTPLTTIQGGAQLLRDKMDRLDEDTRDALLDDIYQESARLTALIQNMVQLTHVRAGRVAYEPEPVLLRVVVERCVGQLKALAPQREFQVQVASDVVAMADAERVDEMLRNVIQNALKYTPADTPIEIGGRDTGEWVKLTVRDHGPGIPTHELEQVFERFERGSRSSSDSPGMGLGLYLVRLLVEAQGGAVDINRPEGGGTEVVFSLPRADADS